MQLDLFSQESLDLIHHMHSGVGVLLLTTRV